VGSIVRRPRARAPGRPAGEEHAGEKGTG
jgi:hypothetical protein